MAKKAKKNWFRKHYILYSLAALVVIFFVVAAFLMWTPPGRSILARQMEKGTAKAIPGWMVIGEIESFGWFTPVITDLEFYHPSGKRVMSVSRVEVNLDVIEMLLGTIGFDSVLAEDGEIVIETLPQGGVTIKDTFKDRGYEKPPDEKIDIEMQNVKFKNMRVLVRIKGEERFALKGVDGTMHLWRHGTPGVRVELSDVSGVFEQPEIMGNKIELRSLNGWVHAKERHVVGMKLKTRIDNGGLEIDLDYFKRKEEPVQIEVRPETGSGARLAAVVLAVKSQFTEKMNVNVDRGKENKN